MNQQYETITVMRHSVREGENEIGSFLLTKLTDDKGREFMSFDKLGWNIKDGKHYKIGFKVLNNGSLRFSQLEEINHDI